MQVANGWTRFDTRAPFCGSKQGCWKDDARRLRSSTSGKRNQEVNVTLKRWLKNYICEQSYWLPDSIWFVVALCLHASPGYVLNWDVFSGRSSTTSIRNVREPLSCNDMLMSHCVALLMRQYLRKYWVIVGAIFNSFCESCSPMRNKVTQNTLLIFNNAS